MSDEKRYTILVAEDDADIIEILELYLTSAGYDVITVDDGAKAYEIWQQKHIDMAVLDIMMPGMNGFELTKKIRESGNIPILILSAKSGDADKILGLDLGADDYMAKPFNPLEVVSRVNANLRRFYNLNESAAPSDNELKMGELALDMETMRFFKGEEEIMLTPTEFKIMAFLMKSPGRVFTRAQIYENVSGEFFESDDNTMMVHFSKLREKIEDDPKNPKYLITVRGLGYKLNKV